MNEIDLRISVNVNYLVHKLVMELSEDEIIKLIIQLDEDSADWGISEKLYEHFKQLHERYLEECIDE